MLLGDVISNKQLQLHHLSNAEGRVERARGVLRIFR